MKLSAFCATFFALASLLSAQQQPSRPEPQAQTPADNGSIPATLIQPIERAANYLNFWAFFNGMYDGATSSNNGFAISSGTALQVGGGISANHDFATGTVQLSYKGDYRSYADPQDAGGTEQNLSFLFRKVLSPRLTFTMSEAAGIFPEGSTLLQPTQTVSQNFVQTSPFSTNMKFTGSTIALAYRQTARLSYEFTGTFYLTRYNSPVSYGNDDVTGTASVLYRLSRDTTLSGSYQYSSFFYQHNAGSAQSNTAYLTLSRNLGNHWTAGLSGGATYTTDSGTILVPYTITDGQYIIPVLVQGHYQQSSTLPYAQASVSHVYKHSLFSMNGGESVTPGNGFLLASRNIGVSGLFSYTMPRSNISAGGYYSRLSSIATTTNSAQINTTDFQASYAYNVIRHVGTSLRYDHINYGSVGAYKGTVDNRITFGIYFTSKDIPVGLY